MAEATRVLTGALTVLEPLAPEHHTALNEIHRTPEVLEFWGDPAEGFPLDEETSARWAILYEGGIAGMIQFYEETEPESRHAGIDIFVAPAVHGRGVGTDAIRTLIAHLFEDLDHRRVVIDPETANTAAIRCYEKAGFEPIGVERKSFFCRGEWQDCLLMDLLRDQA